MKRTPWSCWSLLATLAAAPAAHGQFVNREVEPNDTKEIANVADSGGGGMKARPSPERGDRINGVSTGSGVGTGLSSADYFRVVTAQDPSGLYCYYFEAPSNSAGVETSMRGLSQTGGVINQGTDALAQRGESGPVRNIWYGTGPAARFFLRVTGNSTTTGPYNLEYNCVPYEPIAHGGGSDASQPYVAGSITISAYSIPAADLDFWIYDDQFNPIPGYGHDDPDPAGLTRVFSPGVYYAALTDDNLLNDQPAAFDDANQSAVVLDFPNVTASSSAVFPFATMGLTITANAAPVSISGSKSHPFQVLFFRFVVVDPLACSLCPADFNGDGGVDGSDVAAFFDQWEAGGPCGDVNGDGGIDGQDIEAFFTLWEAGGC
ncbi:MAG: GC-type dockerin domain-anchored protein [Phycisphaerae bacterium]|jgi:hypothetical protein